MHSRASVQPAMKYRQAPSASAVDQAPHKG